MAYTVLADLQNSITNDQLIQLSSTEDNPDVVNTTVVTDAIRRADNLIDSYLRNRYTATVGVPITAVPIPESIRDLSIRITLYFLYRRSKPFDIPDSVLYDYKDCEKLLLKIQSGAWNPFEVVQEPFFAQGSNLVNQLDQVTNDGNSMLI